MPKDLINRQQHWEREEIFAAAETFFASLLQGIKEAQSSIDMDFYIFEDDDLGCQVITALTDAVRRGVRIRVMVDGFGSAFSAGSIARQLHAAGIAVQVFHPFPFTPQLFRWSNEPGSRLHRFLHFLQHANHRNHHKLCIIDEHYLWTGSFNISAQHLNKAQGGNNWHDYGVKITDQHLQPVIDSFNHLFTRQAVREKILHLQKIRSNLTTALRRISNNLLVRRIRNTQKRLWICNAYFSPSPRILRAILQASRKGVDVRIILPAMSDVFFMPLLSRTYYHKLLKEGVKIYEYQPAILHAKLMLADNLCLMGSTNLNHRSYLHDLELDIVLSHPASIQRLEDLLLADMQLSRNITLNDVQQQGMVLFLARFFRLFRYWL